MPSARSRGADASGAATVQTCFGGRVVTQRRKGRQGWRTEPSSAGGAPDHDPRGLDADDGVGGGVVECHAAVLRIARAQETERPGVRGPRTST